MRTFHITLLSVSYLYLLFLEQISCQSTKLIFAKRNVIDKNRTSIRLHDTTLVYQGFGHRYESTRLNQPVQE